MAAKGKVLTAEDIKALQKQIAENKKREEEEAKEKEAEKLAKKQGKEYVPTYSNKKVTATGSFFQQKQTCTFDIDEEWGKSEYLEF